MATIKSYTSLEQSRKLAEILPIESADMYYINEDVGKIRIGKWGNNVHDEDDILCWSLAALLDLMICPKLEEYIEGVWDLTAFTDESLKTPIEVQDYKDPIDACYEMIIKLNELKML